MTTNKQRRMKPALIVGAFLVAHVKACTNIIVTPGASANGSMMLAYSSDDHKSYGQLYHYPKTNGNDDGVDVYEWETGNFLGTIPQAKETYNVVGSCNEYNVCVAETTYGGPPDLLKLHPDSMVDYGSLMYLALQRSKTAKEALDVMTNLGETYGYHSEGESFSIVDPNEAYLMEMISKGQHEVGALWVACPVPDGSIVTHANHARITTFMNDDSCTHSEDVVDFAIFIGLYQPKVEGDFSDFSFSDTYSPKQPYELRYTDARVWEVYRALLPPDQVQGFDERYLPHVMGHEDFARQNVLPIFLVPAQKLTLDDIRKRMGSHYEGTPLEYGSDVAGGMFEMPYKPRPNNWLYSPDNIQDPKMYVNERPIATEKTGFNYIAEIRPLKSNENDQGVIHPRLQTVMWYATDDCSTAPRIPVFPSATKVSSHYYGKGSQQGHRVPIMEFDLSKSFWIQNLVSNLAYYRWKDINPLLQEKLNQVHSDFEDRVAIIEREVTDLVKEQNIDVEAFRWFHGRDHHDQHHEEDSAKDEMQELDDQIVRMLTDFTVDVGNDMHREWTDYWGYLFVRYRDFVTMQVDPSHKGCGCATHEIGISHEWQTRIIQERPDHFRVAMKEDDPSEMAIAARQKWKDDHPQPTMLVQEAKLSGNVATELEEVVTSGKKNQNLKGKVMDSSIPWFATHPLSKSLYNYFGNLRSHHDLERN